MKVTEYINPCDHNQSCYSHRLYELLLRISTEFENLCKYSLNTGRGKPLNIKPKNISDYKELESIWQVDNKEVGLLFWMSSKHIKPFDNWHQNTPSLSWYKAYNTVKHNRDEKFSEASFENTVASLAGLFLALHCEFGEKVFNLYETSSTIRGHGTAKYSEKFINNSIFTIRTPNKDNVIRAST